MPMSLSKLVARQRPGDAGAWQVMTYDSNFAIGGQKWWDGDRKVSQVDRQHFAGSLVLCHYGHPMLAWRKAEPDELGLVDDPDGYELVFASTGWATVSDQAGIRKACAELNIDLSMSRSINQIERDLKRLRYPWVLGTDALLWWSGALLSRSSLAIPLYGPLAHSTWNARHVPVYTPCAGWL